MKVIRGLSLDMEDLTTKNGQINVRNFFDFVVDSIKNDVYELPPLIKEKEVKEYKISL